MTSEEIKGEFDQQNTWQHEQDEAISKLRQKVSNLIEFCQCLETVGFQPASHSQAAGEAKQRMIALLAELKS